MASLQGCVFSSVARLRAAASGPFESAVDGPRKLILITDGRPGDGQAGLQAAAEARELWGIEILTIGVGASVGEFRNTLIRISGAEPGGLGESERYFELTAWADGEELAQLVLAALR